MPSPIKNVKNKTNCFSIISKLIKAGEVVDYYPIYSGEIPIKLSLQDRFVVAHTENRVVYEFWYCAKKDPERISKIAEYFFPTLNENTFDILKDTWFTYKDPFVRSALFFLLNRCSKLGMITHGELNVANFNSFAIRDIKNFHADNMHVNFLKDKTIKDFNQQCTLINAGKYRISFLENEVILGEEETEIKSDQLLSHFAHQKSVFIFKKHKALLKKQNYEKILIDERGNKTANFDDAKEMILHNVR